MAKENENAVAKVTDNAFDVTESVSLLNEMRENYGDLNLRFNKIRFPSSGVPAFAIETEEEGGAEFVKELTGVILYTRPYNAYYPGTYNGDNIPPQCASFDDRTGYGSPGGDCRNCPLNKFGTGGMDGNGKACRNKRVIYLLREGEILPDMIEIPPTSKNRAEDYIKKSFLHRKPVEKAVSKIELVVSDKKTRAEFSRVRMLTPAEIESIAVMAELARDYDAALIDANQTLTEMPLVADPETGEIIEPLK